MFDKNVNKGLIGISVFFVLKFICTGNLLIYIYIYYLFKCWHGNCIYIPMNRPFRFLTSFGLAFNFSEELK